jgi:membrane-associated HD superfamily phosphohydrolase
MENMLAYTTRLKSHSIRSVAKPRWNFSTLVHSISCVELFKLNFYYKQWHSAAWWLTITSVIKISIFLLDHTFAALSCCCWRRWVHLLHTLHSLKTWLLSANYFCQVNWAFTLKSYENRTRYCWINCKYRWRKFGYKLQQHTGRILI